MKRIIATKKETPHIMTWEEIEEDLRQYKKWRNKVHKQMLVVGVIVVFLLLVCWLVKK